MVPFKTRSVANDVDQRIPRQGPFLPCNLPRPPFDVALWAGVNRAGVRWSLLWRPWVMRSLGAPVRECEPYGHNPKNQEDGHLSNSHRAPLDNAGVPGERHGMPFVLPSGKYSTGRTFGRRVRTPKSTKRSPA